MTQEALKKMYQLLLTEPHAETVCFKLEAIAREALAQPPLPEQEPVACRFCHSKKGCWTWQCYNCGEIDDVQQPAPPQQQAEPVAWDKPSDNFNAWWDSDRHDNANPFEKDSYAYWAWAGWQAALAQRPWVGLTEFQFAEIYNKWNDSNGSTPWGLYHAIEKALKAKNHG